MTLSPLEYLHRLMDGDTTWISRVGIMEESMFPLAQGNGIVLLLSGITLKRGGPPSMGMAILPTRSSVMSPCLRLAKRMRLQDSSDRANRPMNMHRLNNCIKQNAERELELEYAHRNVYDTQMHFNHHTQRKITAFIQHVHFILINSKYRIAEVKCTRPLILR